MQKPKNISLIFCRLATLLACSLLISTPYPARAAFLDHMENTDIESVACNMENIQDTILPGGVVVHQSECERRGILTADDFWMEVSYTIPMPDTPVGNIPDFDDAARIGVGECKWLNVASPLPVNFCVEREGDKACAYGYPLAQIPVNSTVIQRPGFPTTGSAKDKTHCFTLPTHPVALPPRPWSNLISTACTEARAGYYDLDAAGNKGTFHNYSRYRQPFIGVIATCVEETMLNLFSVNPSLVQSPILANTAPSFFSVMQNNLRNTLAAILTLYVMMIGFRIVMTQQLIPKQEFIWYILRFGLVIYFVTGTGIQLAMPAMVNSSKQLALLLLDAAGGINISAGSTITTPAPGVYGTGLPTNTHSLTGYNYCDFTPEGLRTLGLSDYEPRNAMMRLWDTVDCKIATYLGIGLGPTDFTPKVYAIAMASIWSTPTSFINTALVSAYLGFFIGYVVRTMYCFVVAITALILLFYVGPILIPAVLFQYTKNVFETWFKEIIGYTLQPVILIAFVAVSFAAMDRIYFGGNHVLTPNAYGGYSVIDSKNGSTDCTDKDAPACLMEQITFEANGGCVLGDWCSTPGVSYEKIGGAVSGGTKLFIGYAKLTLAALILYALSGYAENMSQTLVNVGSSITKMTPNLMRTRSPVEAMKQITSAQMATAAFAARATVKAVDIATTATGLQWAGKKFLEEFKKSKAQSNVRYLDYDPIGKKDEQKDPQKEPPKKPEEPPKNPEEPPEIKG